MTRDEIESRAHELLPQIITIARNKSAEEALAAFAAALVEMHDAGIETAIKATGMGAFGRIAARAKKLGGQR